MQIKFIKPTLVVINLLKTNFLKPVQLFTKLVVQSLYLNLKLQFILNFDLKMWFNLALCFNQGLIILLKFNFEFIQFIDLFSILLIINSLAIFIQKDCFIIEAIRQFGFKEDQFNQLNLWVISQIFKWELFIIKINQPLIKLK